MYNNNLWMEEFAVVLHPFSIALFSFFLLLLIFIFNKDYTHKPNLPPSPSRIPIIGNLHQLGSLPHRTLRILAQEHGPVMLLHLGQVPTLVVSSAEAAEEVMKTHDLVFSDRAKVSFADRLLYDSKDITFAPYADYWRQVRKVCVLQLLSPHRVESFRSIREEECEIMIRKIRRCSAPSVVDLSEALMSFINDATCRVTFGRKFEGEEGSSGRRFWKMISEFLYLLGVFNLEDFMPWLGWVNCFNGIRKRVTKNFEDLDSFLEGVIEEHLQYVGRTEVVEDLVDVLLKLEKNGSVVGVPFAKDNIKAILLDIFSAGTDTISITLIWAMAELIKQPETLKEVQREIREIVKGKGLLTPSDLGQMRYLKLVLKETLRLHPPAPLLVPRESKAATKIGGYDVPAKTRVMVNAWAIGRDATSWEEAEEFQPKRFVNKCVDYQGHDFGMIPFGGGRRGCPGVAFAIANMELPLASLLYHFDWTLPESEVDVDMAEIFGIIVHKRAPLLLVATPHRFE